MRVQILLDNARKLNKKLLAVLIDPDRIEDQQSLEFTISICESNHVDFYMVGGSLLAGDFFGKLIKILKERSKKPVVIFPGSQLHINPDADAIMLLSLISGRNPDLLIGKHVEAAPLLKRSGLEILPTGYLLIGNDHHTTVAYISQTMPIPPNKPEIAATTAMAGEMLGLSTIYLDAGSGASNEIPPLVISQVRKAVDIPIIVGGGIDTIGKAREAYKAGADLIVVGSVVEKKPDVVKDIGSVKVEMNA